jgi:hypothetical protein
VAGPAAKMTAIEQAQEAAQQINCAAAPGRR